VVAAHRLATIRLADRVVFIDEGRVAAQGTHSELMKSVPRYGEVLARAEWERIVGPEMERTTSMPPEEIDEEELFGSLEAALKGMA
jgi:ABC-type multidrug transport system ATPase subunit